MTVAQVRFELGLSSVEAAPGEAVRIYDPPRTVADLMRLRHRFGEPVALGALRRYLRRQDARPAELLRIATVLGVYGPVRHAIDVANAGFSPPTMATAAGQAYNGTLRSGHPEDVHPAVQVVFSWGADERGLVREGDREPEEVVSDAAGIYDLRAKPPGSRGLGELVCRPTATAWTLVRSADQDPVTRNRQGAAKFGKVRRVR
jgi:hypothetical protein